MTTTIEWVRRGCLEIAELPDGKAAEIWHRSGYCCLRIHDSNGVQADWQFSTPGEAVEYIENKYLTKPLATGLDWSFWVSEDKTRSAYVSTVYNKWWTDQNSMPAESFPTREAAEAAAAQYVRGEA